MRTLLFFLFLLLGSTLFSQKKQWDFMISSHFAFIKAKNYGAENELKGNFGIRLGAIYYMQIGGSTFFQSGVELASLGGTTRQDIFQFPSEFDGNVGYVRDPNLDEIVKDNFLFFQIPLMWRKEFSADKKIRAFVNGGLVYGFELVQRRKYRAAGATAFNKEMYFEPFENNILSGRVNIGFKFLTENGNHLSTSLSFQYPLNWVKHSGSKYKYIPFGIEFAFPIVDKERYQR